MSKIYVVIATLSLWILPLAAEPKVVVFSGSLRQDSWNSKLAKEAARKIEEKGAKAIYFDLNEYLLPLFNEDIERTSGMPEAAKKIRRAVEEAQALIIASPNYNGSFSGALKNLLDWISRSEDGQDARTIFKGKKIAIMSASTGKSGGAGGLPHLRHVLEKMGATVLQRQVSVGKAETQFDANGQLSSPETLNLIKEEMEELDLAAL